MLSSLFSETSTTALIVQGTLDSVSAGVLIYTGLVELVTYQITSSPSFAAEPLYMKVASFGFIYFGVCVMAVIGLWG